jgi:hypothetical protein
VLSIPLLVNEILRDLGIFSVPKLLGKGSPVVGEEIFLGDHQDLICQRGKSSRETKRYRKIQRTNLGVRVLISDGICSRESSSSGANQNIGIVQWFRLGGSGPGARGGGLRGSLRGGRFG